MEWTDLLVSLVLLGAGALVGYLPERRLRQVDAKETRIREAEARLHDERRELYITILKPYIAMLSESSRGAPVSETSRRLETVDHRYAAFQLKFVGSDDVVRSFNGFARYMMDAGRMPNRPPGEILRHWAALVLAIRRDIGDPETILDESDMMIDWVDDIERLYPELTFEKRLQDHAVLGAP